MKVFCVMQEQEGGYVGPCLIKIFSNEEKARLYATKNAVRVFAELSVEEREVEED